MTQISLKSDFSESFKTPISIIFFLTLLVFQTYSSHALNKITPIAPADTTEKADPLDPVLFKAITFGQYPAAIDWIWIQVLLDPRLDHVKPGFHPAIYYQLDLIADLDPQNYDSYQAGTNLLAVIRDDKVGAEAFIKKGEKFRKELLPGYSEQFKKKFWQREWQIPFLLAYVELFELDNLPSAAVAFQEAAKIKGAPVYLQTLAHRFDEPGGVYEVGLRILNFMLNLHESDEKLRKELLKKRDSLFIGQYVFDLNHEFGSFLKVNPKAKVSEESFHRFLKESRLKAEDPWGGKLSLNEQGRIVTTTSHQKVFGLD